MSATATYWGRGQFQREACFLFRESRKVLIAFYAYAWRDMLKTERVVRPYIDDIPFRPSYRQSD
jgi:hypothetical protein